MSTEKLPRSPLRPGAERKKRSCSECRRRKQKCDQRQPCRNCSRRMPPPICHYQGSPLREQTAVGLSPYSAFEQAPDKEPVIFPATTVPSPATSGYLDFDDIYWPPTPPGTNYSDDAFNETYIHWDITGEVGSITPSRTEHGDATPYTDSFLPFLSPSRTTSHTSLFIETCQRSAETPVDRDTILAARYSAIQGLHSLLARSDTSASGEAIGAVVNLVMNDICFGEVRELRVHVEGARGMVTARGGLAALGSRGNLAKMLVITDLVTAVALDMAPSFSEEEVSGYTILLNDIYPVLDHSSLPAPTPTTLKPTPPLSSTTAAMLKDISFLLDTVLALPPEPSAWQLQKVQTMSEWVQGRLSVPTAKPTSSSSTNANLHRAVRLSSLVYCRAIQTRRSFSQVIQENDVFELAEAVWTVPLETWDAIPETLVSVLAVGLPTARDIPQCGPTRTMLVAAAVQLVLRDWGAVTRVMDRVVRLQAWLRGVSQG